MSKPNSTERQARAILDFTGKRGIPEFITNAVLVAIEGAAIAHNLPRPYMDAGETDETAAPKIAAILTAAGEMFSLSGALKASGIIKPEHYEAEANQFALLIEEGDELGEFKDFLEDSIAAIATRLGFVRIDEGSGEVRLSPSTIRLIWPHLRMTEGASDAIPILIENITHHLLNEKQAERAHSLMERSKE
jgi:hypothetical protein